MSGLKAGTCMLCIRPHEDGQEVRRAPSGIGWMHLACWEKKQREPTPKKVRAQLTRGRVEGVRPGRFFVIRQSPLHGSDEFVLTTTPGRTNVGRTPLAYGWLGETDGLSSSAEGAIEVYEADDGRMDFREIDGNAILAEWLRGNRA